MVKINLISWFIGFFEGEGCFSVSIGKHTNDDIFFIYTPQLVISVVNNDKTGMDKCLDILHLRSTKIYTKMHNNKKTYEIRITNKDDLKEVVYFFNKYPLQTESKKHAFLIWKQIFELVLRKEYRTIKGCKKLFILREKLNKNSGVDKRVDYSKEMRRQAVKKIKKYLY